MTFLLPPGIKGLIKIVGVFAHYLKSQQKWMGAYLQNCQAVTSLLIKSIVW